MKNLMRVLLHFVAFANLDMSIHEPMPGKLGVFIASITWLKSSMTAQA